MKQYTTPEQTAKLIELGFEKPSPKWVKDENGDYRVKTNDADYDIGELIEMLPMEDRAGERSMVYDGLEWVINWDNDDGTINQVVATEFVDALYDMIIMLKEKGVI